jgi:hypothetical protein
VQLLYVECVARAGRLEQAQLAFEKMLTYANHLGLYSEQIGPSGELLGNFPPAVTHLSERRDRLSTTRSAPTEAGRAEEPTQSPQAVVLDPGATPAFASSPAEAGELHKSHTALALNTLTCVRSRSGPPTARPACVASIAAEKAEIIRLMRGRLVLLVARLVVMSSHRMRRKPMRAVPPVLLYLPSYAKKGVSDDYFAF